MASYQKGKTVRDSLQSAGSASGGQVQTQGSTKGPTIGGKSENLVGAGDNQNVNSSALFHPSG